VTSASTFEVCNKLNLLKRKLVNRKNGGIIPIKPRDEMIPLEVKTEDHLVTCILQFYESCVYCLTLQEGSSDDTALFKVLKTSNAFVRRRMWVICIFINPGELFDELSAVRI
jgi:hypothetical protein